MNWKNPAALKKEDILQAGKIAVGSFLAMLIAEALRLQFAPSAAIIALLTTLATRRETFLLCAKRFLSFVVTIVLSYTVFHFAGIHGLGFGIFMFLLVIVSYALRWHATISVNAVIGTHVLMESAIHSAFILNEFMLVFIGTVVAALLNCYMLRSHRAIQRDIVAIEAQERHILYQFSHYLTHMQASPDDHAPISELEEYLDRALSRAIHNAQNTLFEHSKYFITYMEMRKSQCDILHQILHSLHAMTDNPPQAKIISDYLRHIGDTFGERNNAVALLQEGKSILEYMEEQPLPQSRREFENRAILYHILIELESFLIIKKEFVERLTEEQLRIYWSGSAPAPPHRPR